MAIRLKKFQIVLQKVKLGSRVNMPQGSQESHSQLKLTFRSRFMKKNVLFDPWMTSDPMTVLFEYFPLTNLHIVPKHEMCQTLPLKVIAFSILLVFNEKRCRFRSTVTPNMKVVERSSK